jgi:hypothetical protein
MQRYNVFNQIHKALRALLYDTALSLQQAWLADPAEAAVALGKVETVLGFFDGHAHHEDHFILPAVEAYNKQLVDEFEKEHVTDLALSNRLRSLLNIYRHAVSGEEKLEAGSAITKAFVEFMIFNLQHMAKEEILLNQVLWEHYTDQQIIAIQEKLVATIPPQEMMLSSKWMFRGINNMEAIHWLKAIRSNAPEFVFQSLVQLGEKELPSERWNRIWNNINQPALVA